MKLLIDENISFRILSIIKRSFPNSIHVLDIRRERYSDIDIWVFAKKNGYIIVTYDKDFYEWQSLRGFPPKIIWLRFGNAKTLTIAHKLISNQEEIKKFANDTDVGLLEVR